MNNKKKIKLIKSKSTQIYTPSCPIDNEKFFQGRQSELGHIKENLSMPGKHVIIFGDRGVGKTSLLNIVTKNQKCFKYGCSSEDNYKTIFLEFLKNIGAHKVEFKSVEAKSKQGKLGIDIKVVSGERGKKRKLETEYQVVGEQQLTPHFITSLFKDEEIILALDEFERIEDIKTKKFLSEVVKKFSDANSKSKIIIVGIADSVEDLIGEHESIVRNIHQEKLDRLSEEEIIAIIKSGEEILCIIFEQEVIEMIIDYSDRFPHFAHLLSFGCINSLVNRIEKEEEPFNRIIPSDFFPNALNYAVSTTEETFRINYSNATHSQKNSPIFKHILWACALDTRTEVNFNDIRTAICRLQKRNVNRSELVYPLGTLIKQERGNILYKIRRGCYKFSNPMMKAYVRIALAKENPLAEINGYIGKADLRLKTITEALKLEKSIAPSGS